MISEMFRHIFNFPRTRMVRGNFGSTQRRTAPQQTRNGEVRRRGRGRTVNSKGTHRTSQSQGKVEFSSRLGRAVGGDGMTEFVTEMGVVMRTNAPLDVQKWNHIDDNIKLKMWDILLEKYNGISSHKTEVMALLSKMYRNWRWRKHQDYLKFKTDEQRLQNCPNDVKEEDWKVLVKYFGSEDFKKVSKRNKLNRSKQDVSSVCGRTSFASIFHSMRDPVTKEDPKMIEFWKVTHQRKSNGSWCSEKAEAVLPQLQEISESQQEQECPMTAEEQLTEVFGCRSGHLRGLGSGPKPLSRKNLEIRASQATYRQEVQDLREELQRTKEEAVEREAHIRKENEEREARKQKESEEREARMLKESEEREARHKIEHMELKASIMKEFEERMKAVMTGAAAAGNGHAQ